MMRCANKFPRRLYFMHADDIPPIRHTTTGDIIVSWNTAKRITASKITKPLPVVVSPRAWSLLAHDETPEMKWLIEQGRDTELWMC